MSVKNKNDIFKFFDDATNYLKNLTIRTEIRGRKKLLCKSRNDTAFRGYIISMASLRELYMEIVEEKKYMDTFYTYALSQVHLEIFFRKIRNFHGHNNNPDVINFRSAYRKLCSNIQVMIPQKANCQKFQMDLSPMSVYSDVYFISSRRPKHDENSIDDPHFMKMVESEKDKIHSDILTSDEMDRTYYLTDGFLGASIAFIASQIE